MHRYASLGEKYHQKRYWLTISIAMLAALEAMLEHLLRKISPDLATFVTFAFFLYGGSFFLLVKAQRKKAGFLVAFCAAFGLYLKFLWLPLLFVLLYLYRPFYPFFRWVGCSFFIGAAIGLLLGAHLWLSVWISGALSFRPPSLDLALFPLLINAPLEELFYRRAVFAQLHKYSGSFAFAATFAFACAFLRYALNPGLFSSLLLFGGSAIYLALLHFSLCLLYVFTRSLWATTAANALFGFFVQLLTIHL